jgi:hypothetical protein
LDLSQYSIRGPGLLKFINPITVVMLLALLLLRHSYAHPLKTQRLLFLL